MRDAWCRWSVQGTLLQRQAAWQHVLSAASSAAADSCRVCALPQHMRDVVTRCLQKDPKQRPSATELLQHKFFKVSPRLELPAAC